MNAQRCAKSSESPPRTPLLATLGAREIPRQDFLQRVTTLVNYAEPAQCWKTDDAGMVFAQTRRAGSGKR